MPDLTALSHLHSTDDILERLNWHAKQRVPLALFLDRLGKPMDALVHRIDKQKDEVLMLCEQELVLPLLSKGLYAAIGSTAREERFMGSGRYRTDIRNPYALHLTLPQWLDMVIADQDPLEQPLHGILLHIGNPDPHQKDQVCRVLELRSGSVIVEWNDLRSGLPPVRGQTTLPALVFLQQRWLQLGRLQVVDSQRSDQGMCIELAWDADKSRMLATYLQAPTLGDTL